MHFNLHIIQLEHKLNTSIQTPPGKIDQVPYTWVPVCQGTDARTVEICPPKTDGVVSVLHYVR